MLILFCGEDYGSVSWNSPIGDYQIFDWRVNILIQVERSVRRHSDYSSDFLCPHTPLLRCVPNQNRDATQVAYFICCSESRYISV